ncbi:putative long-chain-alcohol O-fatty-acyltransferase 4 [Dichanthelium oligosanthes]|uniref:Putative long-chain-alcohol O-fatty-acyltransferase 4 n=1 Tax=Dichanthelium oligosanthes TaxID=888268 RepID=A0A1E5VG61_9POAL|nr:putative long-chain-alcohol O-fatty-acyltransferase 4 [Dichanthelium oligosanthes]
MLSYAAKAAFFAVLVSVRCYRARLPEYAVPVFDGAHVYLMLELFLASPAAVARALLGTELEPEFDRPYLASSLRDFWSRQWNLMVPGVLRPCVYRPVRARLGAAAGVLAAFLVSGLMHEVMFYYITLEAGTGEVTAFFALHGACAVAERWCAAQRLWRDWRPPRPVAMTLTLALVTATGSWIFFAPVIRSGLDKGHRHGVRGDAGVLGAGWPESGRGGRRGRGSALRGGGGGSARGRVQRPRRRAASAAAGAGGQRRRRRGPSAVQLTAFWM